MATYIYFSITSVSSTDIKIGIIPDKELPAIIYINDATGTVTISNVYFTSIIIMYKFTIRT
ncbi:hypothetical protein AB84_3232 [Escherichia coli 2-052-05_S3_C1]|nr:hypothetical protein AB84_3232 [Escherichia coli 2-052-05_S3_C1]KDV81128.1 hypothetical protein AC42_3183 [Escherichia coli 2-052-05_S3_C3]